MHAIVRLQHHFWGDYKATIIAAFDTPEQAARANDSVEFADWDVHEREPRALVYHGGGAELKANEAMLVKFGADKKKLGSLAKSIDFGETTHIDFVPHDGTTQQTLFEAAQ